MLNAGILQRSHVLAPGDEEKEEHADEQVQLLSASRKRDIALNFTMFAVPMLAIPLILLAFVIYTKEHPVFTATETVELPIIHTDAGGKYTTRISATALVLVGSWASSAAQFVMAPFMILFSFIIARAIQSSNSEKEFEEVQQVLDNENEQTQKLTNAITTSMSEEANQTGPDELVKGIAKAVTWDVFNGLVLYLFGKKHKISRAARIALIGGTLSATFTILLIIGDNILHLSVEPISAVVYEDYVHPDGSRLYDDYTCASFKPIEECQNMLQSPISVNDSNIIPCSINKTDSLFNLANTVYAYSVLDEGISQQTDSFFMDHNAYLQYQADLDVGDVSDIQVVTYQDPQTHLNHALLFNMTAATIFSDFVNGTYSPSEKTSFFGTDFAASTVSMVTQCVPATEVCGMRNVTRNDSAISSDLSVPFNCSPIFSGDAWQSPNDGLQRFPGWHSKFFDSSTGTATDISTSSQLNPFYWNVTGVLTSADFAILERVNDTQVSSGAVVDAGSGRVALALTCKSTVYSVDYSVVSYQIRYFNAVPADPRLASIVKAPLQFGFGRHELYIQAQIAIMLNNVTVASAMSDSFSQIGMALASGAFETDFSRAQRVRYRTIVTAVSGHALWFIVVTCLLYAAIGIGFGAIAFAIQRNSQYAEYQAQIVPMVRVSIRSTLKELGKKAFGKAKDLFGALKQD